MAKKRYSVRVLGTRDDSVLARGDEIVFMRSIQIDGRRIPMGAMGRLTWTFPQLELRLHAPWRRDSHGGLVRWPPGQDPREVILKVDHAAESGWVEYDVTAAAALLPSDYPTTRPPPSTRPSAV